MSDNAPTLIEEGPTTIATVGAVLAVDIGSLYTRAVMFDVVGDEYRFVAKASAVSTAEAPNNDVTASVYNAVRELEQITGRKLTEDTRLLMPQRADGNGLDLFIATSSAAPALSMVVAGVSRDISGASAMRAAQSTYTQVMSTIALDEGISELPTEDAVLLSSGAAAWLQSEGDKLLSLPPDVVLMSGGVDNGPVAPLVRLAYALSGAASEQSRRAEEAARVGKSAPGMPTVIYAGNSAALEAVTQALAPISEVEVVPGVRPTIEMEQITPAASLISDLYKERRVPEIPGYSVLSRWVAGEIVPTAEAERLIARYLYAHYGREILLVDVGATSTSLILANAVRDDAVVLGDMGLGYGLGNLLAERGAANVLRWLPFEMDDQELTDWILNKVIRPLTLPMTARDLAIEHALAREALQSGLERLEPGGTNNSSTLRYDLLVGTGGLLAHAPRPGQAALLLLDALQPTGEGLGSIELALDTTLLIPALGNLARHHLAATSYIFDRDCLQWLGTAIVPMGHPRDGFERNESAKPRRGGATTAVTITVERKKGEAETVEVPYGSITVIPLRPDQRAALAVKPASGFSVGGGEPGKTLKTEPGQEVKGGLVGLIVDARGRPLELPDDPNARRSTVNEWWTALDAVPTGETFMTTALEGSGVGDQGSVSLSSDPRSPIPDP